MVGMRKWRWRGAALIAGIAVAAGFGVAGQWRGGLVGAAVIGVGGFVAPEVAGWLRARRERAASQEAADAKARELLDRVSAPAVVARARAARGGDVWWLRSDQRV